MWYDAMKFELYFDFDEIDGGTITWVEGNIEIIYPAGRGALLIGPLRYDNQTRKKEET